MFNYAREAIEVLNQVLTSVMAWIWGKKLKLNLDSSEGLLVSKRADTKLGLQLRVNEL